MGAEQNPEISGLRIYSIGKAANNKALNSTELEVTPIEQLNMLDGEIVGLPFDSEVSGVGTGDEEYTSKVTMDVALTAKWMPMASNRTTPPDVRRGERVLIWRYLDTDEFFWTELDWDLHLRRLETVTYRFSANPAEGEEGDPTIEANSYWLQISTHLGLIHLLTAQANGEKAQYEFQINTKEGIVVMLDNHGNFSQTESVAKVMTYQNGDGTFWKLDKLNLLGYCKDMMHVKAEKKIHLVTKDFLLETETGQINASKSFGIKTPSFKVESDTNLFQTPNTTFTGNVSIAQNLTAAAGGSGMATFQGPVTFKAASTFEAHIQANGITSTATIKGPRDSI